MKFGGGYFVITIDGKSIRQKNTLVTYGAQAILMNDFQADASMMPASFYLGLTGSGYEFDSDLPDISNGEPVGNGYVRQALSRDAGTWTVSLENGIWRVQSTPIQFAATGQWTKTWMRAFLATTVDNTGHLFCISGPLANGQQTTTTANPPLIAYEYWVRP